MFASIGAQAGYGDPCTIVASNTFTVLSNNVGLFPAAIVERYPEKLREKKQHIMEDEQQRAGLLATSLIEFEGDPDAVLLQEIWSLKARDILIRELESKYPYCKHPLAAESAAYPLQPSGLMIFSKYPLVEFRFAEFDRGFGLDKLSRKGILGVRLIKEGKPVALFTTHLQAGGKRDPTVKRDQLRQCREFMRAFVGDDQGATIILAGDFNIDSSDPPAYDAMLTQLAGANDSYRAGCGRFARTVRPADNPHKRIDYLLTFNGVEAISTIVDPAGNRVSDHLAVFGTVSLDGDR